jgi:hypothetical protein
MVRSHTLPQVAPVIDEALALVCNVPLAARDQRRVDAMSVVDRATGVRDIDNGVALTFDGSADTARTVVDFALAERDCCAQFTYSILFAPHASSVELRIIGSAASVQPLRGLYLGLAQEKRHG